MFFCYDKNGEGISIDEWKELFSPEYNAVGHNLVNDFEISTVWLGLDYSFQGRPIIFETMVRHKGREIFLKRYSTLAEAEAGHQALTHKFESRKKQVTVKF
jgi:hypothetical protein